MPWSWREKRRITKLTCRRFYYMRNLEYEFLNINHRGRPHTGSNRRLKYCSHVSNFIPKNSAHVKRSKRSLVLNVMIFRNPPPPHVLNITLSLYICQICVRSYIFVYFPQCFVQTIPRLELVAAHMATNLLVNVQESLEWLVSMYGQQYGTE